MSAEVVGSAWMAETASRYKTTVTKVNPNGDNPQLILKANPRRWYLEIRSAVGNATMGNVLPGPFAGSFVMAGAVASPLIYKWKDSPALIGREWYGLGTDVSGWIIIEETFTD